MKIAKINVSYCLDEEYLIPFCASLQSLLTYNADHVENIYLLHSLEDQKKKKLLTFKNHVFNEFSIKIIDYKVVEEDFMNLRINRHIHLSTYFRFKIPSLLPTSVDSVLNIDPDTIITAKLEEIYKIDFNNEPDILAYAVAQNKIPTHITEQFQMTQYFNAGVIFFNLKAMRSKYSFEELIQYSLENKSLLKFHDQDVLNIHLKDRWKKLPMTYNVYHNIQKLIKDQIIIHYTGNRKPWHLINIHKHNAAYWKFFKQTPFGRKAHLRQFTQLILTFVLKHLIFLTRKMRGR